jgi:hypothetical protein
VKLTRDRYDKAFNEKIVKRAGEKFYTVNDPQCLWTKEQIGVRIREMENAWTIDDPAFNEPMQSRQRTLGSLLTPNPTMATKQLFETSDSARWVGVGGFRLYLGSHEFTEKIDKRTYRWESQTLAVRKFILFSRENNKLEERVNLVEFKVLWRADVKADARFYDLALEDIRIVKKEFRNPTIEEIARFRLDELSEQPTGSE